MLRLITTLTLLLAAQLCAETKPNVLFIAVDDLNDMVGFLRNHPGVKTPNMDKLAARGVNFTRAYCAAPGCAPSRGALLTGRRPSTTGNYTNRDDWRKNPHSKELTTLPESFQKAGYLTRGGGKIYHSFTFIKKGYTGHFDPEPWDEYFPSEESQMPTEVSPKKWPVNSSEKFYKGHFDWASLDIDDDEMADGKVVSWAEKQLREKHEQPLFLAVGIYRPHVPWWTPKEYFDQHPLDAIRLPEVQTDDLADLPEIVRKNKFREWHKWVTGNGQWERAVQGYLASMTFADAMVGRLLTALENGPNADNTIIVLWSDHGYHLGHKERWEKFALWEQTTHVPLIFADTRPDPAWPQKAKCEQPVSLLDIYPTLVELCRLAPVEGLEGKSLAPQLREPSKATRRAVITTHKYKNHAIRDARWRFIRYADGSEELYDHEADPNEFTNLANDPKHAETMARLAKHLPSQNRKPMPVEKPAQK